MRTTVTLDNDVQRLLKDEMHRRRQSFKETLNTAVRNGLQTKPPQRRKFVVKAQAMGLRPGIDPDGFNRLLDEMESEAVMEKVRGIKKR
jgi:hypothetical protein